MVWPFIDRRERMRRQASAWIAKLNGPQAGQHREAFRLWYDAHPDHAAAYDRLAAVFEAARGIPARQALPAVRRAQRPRYAVAAAVVVVLAFVVLAVPHRQPASPGAGQSAVFLAAAHEARQVELADGSRVALSPESKLDVAIDGGERRMRLVTGEGRFTVARDPRPFVVDAGQARIVARGTEFVVRLGEAGAVVFLVHGRVEVSYPARAGSAARHVAGLTPGQTLHVPAAGSPIAGPQPSSPERPRMIEFDDIPLAEAVDRINRQGEAPIRLADPALGERRITGAFRAHDAPQFARAVAAALALEVEQRADGGLTLRDAQARPGAD